MCLILICVVFLLNACNQPKEDESKMNDIGFNEAPQTTSVFGEIISYSDEQLSEIAELAVTKDELTEEYPTKYIQRISMVQNNISDVLELCYRGETKVLCLMFDSTSGNKISSHFYSALCLKQEFDTLAIGQLLSDVQMIDPKGEYLFLHTGRNDVPRVSTHYTTDGYVIRITYDVNHVIEKIDIVPM